MPKTPAEKLGIKPGDTLAVHNSPDGALAVLGPVPDRVSLEEPRVPSRADVVVLFAAESRQLRRDAPAVLAAARDATRVWIAYPKGGSSDLTRDTLMVEFVDRGWRGVSLVSLDARWSAARFRPLDQIGH